MCGHFDGMLIGERGRSVVHIDVVPAHVLHDGLSFGGCHSSLVCEEIVNGSATAHGQVDA